MADLAAFLARASRTPFAFGTFDCCLWLADWLVELGSIDPAADLRGRYRTGIGCARVLARHGGVRAVVARCAARAGLGETDAPRAGDVGVVPALTRKGFRQVGAICTGPRWAILSEEGLTVLQMAPHAAWRV